MSTLPVQLQQPLQVRPRAQALTAGTIAVLLFYSIAFPKAGFRLGGVPITFGYFITVLLLGIALLRATRFAVPLDRLILFGSTLLLAFWAAIVVRQNGAEQFGYTLGFFVSILYIPLFGLIFFSGLVLDEFDQTVLSVFKWAVRFVVAYGIFLFWYRQLTGHWIELPFLTVNADDVGTLDDKNINRGGIFKLISTYNNGNIFGVSMCTLGPLFLRIERSRWWRLAFFAALLLTLSRTAWIGLVAIVLLRQLSRQLSVQTLVTTVVLVGLAAVLIYVTLILIGLDESFLFDRDLGGRADQIYAFGNAQVIPAHVVKALPEIVYSGILTSFGYVGLVLFLGFLLMPSVLLKVEGVPLLSISCSSACLQGLLTYALVAASDAAFTYIPVMMIFWMIVGLGFWFWSKESRSGTRTHAYPG